MRFPKASHPTQTILVLIMVFAWNASAQQPRPRSEGPQQRRVVVIPSETKISREDRRKLAVTADEAAEYSNVLSLPDTGIFRLVPDPGCFDNPRIVKADPKCLEAVPMGAFYSFRRREHAPEIFADLRVERGMLITDPILAQGLITDLGDVPVESVTLETPGLAFIRNYRPSPNSREALRQFNQIIAGVRSDGFLYAKSKPAREGTTFALRVTAYRASLLRSYRWGRYDVMSEDKRVDILVAFRVVSVGPDGSLTLVWRQLEKKQSPKLKVQRGG